MQSICRKFERITNFFMQNISCCNFQISLKFLMKTNSLNDEFFGMKVINARIIPVSNKSKMISVEEQEKPKFMSSFKCFLFLLCGISKSKLFQILYDFPI